MARIAQQYGVRHSDMEKSVNNMSLKDVILSQFEPEVQLALIEFGKSLSSIDADVLVFMARKSLCLYDLLLYLGVPPVGSRQKCLVSDRVLDLDLAPWSGKKMALVDDTLILGTSLAEAQAAIARKFGYRPPVHVFAVDTQYWLRELVEPDSITLEMTDAQILSFSIEAIRALSLMPRPYSVDFPLTEGTILGGSDYQDLLSLPDWSAHSTSTRLQDRNGAGALSLFPVRRMRSSMGIGRNPLELQEIVKVRAFTRKTSRGYTVRFVPMVTLRPLTVSGVDDLFNEILGRLEERLGAPLKRVRNVIQVPQARQRFAQYMLSAGLGDCLARSLSRAVGSFQRMAYSSMEADRHYGPYLHEEMIAATSVAFETLWGESSKCDFSSRVAPTALPVDVPSLSLDSLAKGMALGGGKDAVGDTEDQFGIDMVDEFTQVFIEHHNCYELAARREAWDLIRKQGMTREAYLASNAALAPNRERLKIGIPWSVLASHLRARCGTTECADQTGLNDSLSLVLDFCTDWGISVPVTCRRGDVVFMAYRHGEPVLWGNQERALVYEAVKGFLERAQRDSMPRLILEKLLVLFILVGSAGKFLRFWRDEDGLKNTAAIGFYLKGAVLTSGFGAGSALPDSPMLTRELVGGHDSRRVLEQPSPDGLYYLGRKPGGVYPDGADSEAQLVGIVLAELHKSNTNPSGPLDDRDLILLTTCGYPRHAAAAVNAELRILANEWPQIAKQLRDRKGYSLKTFLKSNSREAMPSARMKLVGYFKGEPDRIVRACADYLGGASRSVWKSWWAKIKTNKPEAEKNQFDPLIREMGTRVWELGACVYAVEAALWASQADHPERARERAIRKVLANCERFSIDLSSVGIAQPELASRIALHLSTLASSNASAKTISGTLERALTRIDERMVDLAQSVSLHGDKIALWGRPFTRYSYDCALWYDLYDSRANLSVNQGVDLDTYSDEIRIFQDHLSMRLGGLKDKAKRARGEVFLWRVAPSTDDADHMFFRGEASLRHLEDALGILFDLMRQLPDVKARLLVVPWEVVGRKPWRYPNDTTMNSEFMTHLASAREEAKRLQTERGNAESFLVVAYGQHSPLADRLRLPGRVSWIDCRDKVLTSKVEMKTLPIWMRHGTVDVGAKG